MDGWMDRRMDSETDGWASETVTQVVFKPFLNTRMQFYL